MTLTKEQLWAQIEEDPGNPLFVDYAKALVAEGDVLLALDVCFTGLQNNPICHQGRLVLARIMFERGWLAFAAREIKILKGYFPQSKSLDSLLARLDPESHSEHTADSGVASATSEEVLAESDFEFDDLDLLDQDE